MRNGIDTDFLVALEIEGHPNCRAACRLLEELVSAKESLAIAPQVLAEFVHVVTDGKRLPIPLSMEVALKRAKFWWEAKEVEQVFPCSTSVVQGFDWMEEYSLVRKRVLDTQLASTLHANGVTALITNNHADFRIFGCFQLLGFGA